MEALKPDSLLNHFPPDIWAYLAYYLPGEQLGRLKLSGSRFLWSQLILPNVVKSVKLGTDFLQFNSWPAFLNEFPSIEELSIDSPSHDWWSALGLNMSTVPSTVRKLTIGGSVSTFENFFLDASGKKSNFSKRLPHLDTLDLSGIGFSMSDLHPRPTFPSTLTSLNIEEWDVKLQLPPSLIHLTLSQAITASSGLKLPPRLEKFGVYTFIDEFPPFPPTLTSFQVSGRGSFVPARLSKNLLLLPALTELDVVCQNMPSSLWPSLPPGLKKLAFSTMPSDYRTEAVVDPISDKTHYVPILPLELLPKSISYLRLRTPDARPIIPSEALSPASSTYFPPSLTTLIASHHLSSQAAKFLTSSHLTHLNIGNLCERICEHLPKGLTYLKSVSAILSPNLIKHLPKSLNTFELYCAPDTATWFDYTTGLKLNSILELDVYSTHKNGILHWNEDTSLPRNLTSLKLWEFENFGDSFSHQQLPNLTELDMPASIHFTDLFIPFLNRHLTSINLHNSKAITGKSFPHLPRNLLVLGLHSSSLIFDSDIQHLPRCLKTAYLWSAIHLTDDSIQHFPRHMVCLQINVNTAITTSCLPNLPYPLKSSSHTFRTAKVRNVRGELRSD